jgi:hypothetical protein
MNAWLVSSYSVCNGACVQVAPAVLVRDSKDEAGPVLEFSPAARRAFTASLQTGEPGRSHRGPG